QAEDGIRDFHVTGVQTCALPIWLELRSAEFETIEALLSAAFVRFGKPRLIGAVIAVAAPVSGGVGRFTNRPWRVDAAVMAEALEIGRASCRGSASVTTGAVSRSR